MWPPSALDKIESNSRYRVVSSRWGRERLALSKDGGNLVDERLGLYTSMIQPRTLRSPTEFHRSSLRLAATYIFAKLNWEVSQKPSERRSKAICK